MPEKTTEKTTEKILCIIKNNPRVTYRELAEALAMSEDGIYWSVKQLRKQGLLHRIGGRKEGYWQDKHNSCTLLTDLSPRDDREISGKKIVMETEKG